MRPLFNQLGGDKIFLLKNQIAASPLTVKSTPDDYRVPLESLENVYKNDPLVFNTINKMTQIIMRAGYKWDGDSKSVDFIEDFVAGIGKSGGKLTWDELLTKTFSYPFIYGRFFWELVPNAQDNVVVDLDMINPTKIDYAKDSREYISLDMFGNPIGYSYELPFGSESILSMNPPKGVNIKGNSIFLPRDRVVQFKLFTKGDGFYPIGLVEPIYNISISKARGEEDFANANKRLGNPLVLMKIGDNLHEPTDDQLKNAASELKNINVLSTFSHAYFNELKILESKQSRFLRSYLDYYIDQQVAGMGVPSAIATGAGETANKFTLARQEYILKLGLHTIISNNLSVINSLVVPRIMEEGLKPPKLVWGEISLEEMDSKANRLTNYAKNRLLTPDLDIENLIRKEEGLPPAKERKEEKPEKETKPEKEEEDNERI